MLIFYFSGTGNSLHAAKVLAGSDGTLVSIPSVSRQRGNRYKDEAVGFVYPCYWGGTPKPVIDFMKNNTFETPYLFAVMTYGNFCAAGTGHFVSAAAGCGLKVDYTAEVLTVDNFLPLYDLKKQKATASGKDEQGQLIKISGDIKERKQFTVSHSLLRRLVSAVMQRSYLRKHGRFAADFSVADGCTRCGLCAKICPAANVIVSEGPVFGPECEQCFACIHNCPEQVIHHRKEKNGERYRHPQITVQELVRANNQ